MSKIKIGIQKSGRLYEDSIKILKDSGISVQDTLGKLKIEAPNFPLEAFFLRNSDIPQYLKDGVIDAAIIGSNLLFEKAEEVPVVEYLGFSKCRVSVGAPKGMEYRTVQDLEGKRIATSYPHTVNKFLKSKGIAADIHQISGSVEIAPGIGLADVIVDIVSSGNTLFTNNLKEVEVILHSEAVLAVSPLISKEVEPILESLRFRFAAVIRAKKSKYILLNAPNDRLEEISSILPGMRSPTVVPLAQAGWSSVQSVIDEETFWQVIAGLKKAGAEGILVCPIEKIVF